MDLPERSAPTGCAVVHFFSSAACVAALVVLRRQREARPSTARRRFSRTTARGERPEIDRELVGGRVRADIGVRRMRVNWPLVPCPSSICISEMPVSASPPTIAQVIGAAPR